MATEQQIAANRLNAQLSSGPKTEAARNRSRMNALRHGLTGQVATMTDEDRAAHDQFSKALMMDLAPEGAMFTFDEKVRPYPHDALATGSTCGRQLAQRIATDSWRLNRISAIEDNLFALGQLQNAGQACPGVPQLDAALISARVFTLESKHLQLLSLYEQGLNCAVQKSLAILQSLQAARKSQRESAMKEAAAILKLSEMKGLEYFPQKDGFLFSTAEIHAAIDRDQRLQRASTTDFTKYRSRSRFCARAA